jgi:hypothetical protein
VRLIYSWENYSSRPCPKQRLTTAGRGSLLPVQYPRISLAVDGQEELIVNGKRASVVKTHLDGVVQLGEHPEGLFQGWVPGLSVFQRRRLEYVADGLLLFDLKSR